MSHLLIRVVDLMLIAWAVGTLMDRINEPKYEGQAEKID